METYNIERICRPTREQFENNYLLRSKPIVLTGVMDDWLAKDLWDLDYLRSKIGEISVNFRKGTRNIHPDIAEGKIEEIHTSKFSSFCELMSTLKPGDRAKYMISSQELNFFCAGNVNHNLDILREDFQIPNLFDHSEIHVIGLWLSTFGARSWLHYDGNEAHNLNIQISGKKTVRLYHPNSAKDLKLLDSQRSNYISFSEIDLETMNQAETNILQNLPTYQATLSPGDMLFIPAFWFHTFFHSGEVNINLNFWWRSELVLMNSLVSRSKYLQAFWKALTGVSSPSLDERQKSLDKLSVDTKRLFKEVEALLILEA